MSGENIHVLERVAENEGCSVSVISLLTTDVSGPSILTGETYVTGATF